MQTFLPYANYEQSAKCLDYKRLGKQRLEAKHIINIICNRANTFKEGLKISVIKAFKNHPAVSMWRGYDNSLKLYYNTILNEWIQRGYNNNMLYEDIIIDLSLIEHPFWLGNMEFHNSHKSNLLRKDSVYYKQFKYEVSDDLPYVWPL